MRKVLLYTIVGIVGLVVLVCIVGFLLPKQHEAYKSEVFRAAPPKVFEVISDFLKYPQWRTDVTSVDVTPAANGQGPLVTEHSKNGVIPYRIEVIEPPSKLVMRIADSSLPFGGTWTFEITPNDSGSDVTITERGEIYNPIFRVMGKIFMSPTASIETYLADLKRRLGE
jgi:Polyketide cyclase / dehydrase and lipid transport